MKDANHCSTDLPAPALGAGAVAADAVTVAQVREGPRRAPRLQVPRHPHRRAHLQPVVHPCFGEVAGRQALLGLTGTKHAQVHNRNSDKVQNTEALCME